MDGDRPIKRVEDDRLGFAPVASQLAQAIIDQGAKEGLVFGVEGKWGSGKSTLINLTIASLKALPNPPEIIEFSPWLVGSRDDLLKYLFDELVAAAARILPADTAPQDDATWWQRLKTRVWSDSHTRLRRKQIAKEHPVVKKLRAFGTLSGGLAKTLKAAGAAGVPLADFIGTGVEKITEAAGAVFTSTSLAKRKGELIEALRLLPGRIVVLVDDLDRLEPREASEVLRLIRAVADFPNVIYVLSYDVGVVAKTLQQAVQVDDGLAYLEKIVQVNFKVPRPEAFDLRRWFHDEVRSLFAAEISENSHLRRTAGQRLAEAIDIQGGRYLNTPRDVVRALNALRLHATPVRPHIDIPDMVWLQLVRIWNPNLYAWIEEYLTEASAIYRGAQVAGNAATQMGVRLDGLLTTEGLDVEGARFDLGIMLPGISRGFVVNRDDDAHRVYNNLGREAFNQFVIERRLGSPEHYRYYFAFAQPAGALRDDQVEAFIELSQSDVPAAVQMFTELAGQVRPQGGVMAELLIERLIAARDRIPPAATPGIIASLSASLDTVALSSRDGDFGQHRAWGAAEHLVSLLLKRIDDAALRTDCLNGLFSTGQAIGWQTSLLRSEIFAHGHYGDRVEPEEQRLLTIAEFPMMLATMLRRYSETTVAHLMAVPNLVSLLYGWKQGARNDDARLWVERNTQSDVDLLTFLSRARGWSSSNAGIQYPLKRGDLANFLDYDQAVRRVQAIADNPQALAEQRQLAAELLLAFQHGQRD